MAVKQKDETVKGTTLPAAPQATSPSESFSVTNAFSPKPVDQDIPKTDEPSPVSVAPGVSKEDLAWWGLKQNQNYMAGDGPGAGQTHLEDGVQSASSMEPAVRAAGLEKSKKDAADAAKASAEATAEPTVGAISDAKARDIEE